MEGQLHLLSGLCSESSGRWAGPNVPTHVTHMTQRRLSAPRPTQSHLLQTAFPFGGGPSSVLTHILREEPRQVPPL